MLKSLLFFVCICSLTSNAQFQNILISNLNHPSEVSIAINPKNTNQIVAGSNINNQYNSMDSGLSWQTSTITCNTYGVFGDPVLLWDTANAAYYIHLSDPPSSTIGGSGLDRIVVQKTIDGGVTYPQCVGVGKNGIKEQDKAWGISSPFDNSIHLTWTQFDGYNSTAIQDSSIIRYAKSIDGGLTWTNPIRISRIAGNCLDKDETVEGAVPAIGPNNEIYVSWSGSNGLMFQKSLDGGLTWMPQETVIANTPGGWDYNLSGLFRCNGLPFTSCDLSNGPNRGTIYVNWSDQRAGSHDIDIFTTKSVDSGVTWSLPTRVNNDAPGKQQYMSTMCIDQVTGFVYVLFYDRRNFAGNDSTDVYMGVSKDGGVSYQNYKVNETSFLGAEIGDYIGISAHNNVVRPIWTKPLLGYSPSIFTAIINGNSLTSIKDIDNVLIYDLVVAPNPTINESHISFHIEKKAIVTAQLINQDGRIIIEPILNKVLEKGLQKLTISKENLKLPAGVYYLVFFLESKSQFIKLIFE